METLTSAKGTVLTINDNGWVSAQLPDSGDTFGFWLSDVVDRNDGKIHGWVEGAEKKIGKTIKGYVREKAVFLADDPISDRLLELAAQFKAAQTEEKAAEKKKEKERFGRLVESGVAFRTAEVPAQYDCELMWARRFTAEEKAQYTDWFKELGVYSLPAGGRIKVEREAIMQVVGNRPADAQFNGCTNEAWTITEDEWNSIVRLSGEIRAEKEARRKRNEAAEAADIQAKIASGFCFNCESWCHGDCGNYSSDPNVLAVRNFKRAVTEQNYGIED